MKFHALGKQRSTYPSLSPKKKKRRRTNARVRMNFSYKFFLREIWSTCCITQRRCTNEIRVKTSTQSPQQSVIREGETRTNREKSNSLSKDSAKEEPIPSGVKSNEDRNTCYCFTLGDTYPINALTSRENDLLSIIIDF